MEIRDRQKPWNQLGTDISSAKSVSEAIYQAGLTWNVEQRDVYVDTKIVPKCFANVRTDDGTVMGIVSDRYKIVQNSEAFTFVDSLVDYGAHFVRAGEFHHGTSIWLMAEMPEYKILDDVFENNICFINSHNGLGSIRVCMTPTRVVCSNVLNFALKNAVRSWSAIHAGKIQTKLEEARNTLGLATAYTNELTRTAEEFAAQKMCDADFEHIFDIMYPIDRLNDTERKIKSITEMKENLFKCLLANDIRVYTGTKYLYLNAITDYVAHVAPRRASANYQENNFNKIVNGHQFVDKMYNKIAML